MSCINKFIERAQSFKMEKQRSITQKKEDMIKQVVAVLQKNQKKRTDEDLKLVVPYAKKVTLFND